MTRSATQSLAILSTNLVFIRSLILNKIMKLCFIFGRNDVLVLGTTSLNADGTLSFPPILEIENQAS